MTDAEFLKNFVFEAHALYHIDDAALNEIKAIAQRLEDDEWKPIETAPEKGMVILFEDGFVWSTSAVNLNRHARVTHWKPLPKGPL